MRTSTQLVLFFVFMNAGAQMLATTGVAADLGMTTNLQAPDELADARQTADRFRPGQGTGATLFGLYATLASVVTTFYNVLLPGMVMLRQTPIPNWFIDFLSSGLLFIAAINVISFLRGVSL